MASVLSSGWSETGEVDRGRRNVLVLGAAAAAALFLAGHPASGPLVAPQPGLTAAEIVRSFGKARWAWTVELAVLHHIETDRRYALDLLWAALELDLDPAVKWRRKHALRLYDLYAAASDPAGRAALAHLVMSRTSDRALLARVAFWIVVPRRRRSPLWRTTGPGGRPLGIHLAPA